MSKRGVYVRAPYEASRHCGAPIDRDPERIRQRMEAYLAKADEFRALAAERVLTKAEKIIFGRKVRMAEFMRANLKKLEEQGPDDRPCMHTKGQGTDHPGVGLCRFHCSCKGREGGHLSYYSRKAADVKLQELLDEMDQSSMDVLDLEPDVKLLRAKIKMFVDNKKDFEPETVKSLGTLIETLRRVVETINDKRFKASISLETFNLIQYRMAEVLMKYITDPEILDKIALDWTHIAVKTGEKRLNAMIKGSM